MLTRNARLTRAWVMGIILALAGSVLAPMAQSATALSGSDFNPALIISDESFYNANAMSEAQIQAFLGSNVPSCANGNCLSIARTNTTSRGGDAMCGPYSGAPAELTSTIIFKVQQACGISAKVLLVTLQKEQALVTARAPSPSTLDRAMGYACPDNTAIPGWCDPQYGGLYNQIYLAAWQFKRYGNPPGTSKFFTWFPVGSPSAVQYHPAASCGARVITIQNKATAALYYYTPYQPNAAALANLTGTGDGCSAYGNRNFWVFYNNWFGSPTASGTELMTKLYQSQGGAGGWLGPAVSPLTALTVNGGGLRQGFVGGNLYWSPSSAAGARIVSGAILSAYLANGGESGSLGWPTGDVTQIQANGVTGQYQTFQGGGIYWTAANGAKTTYGAIYQLYASVQASGGFLGWPTTDAAYDSANGSGLKQVFQGGAIFWSAPTGARIVSGAVLTAYTAAGGQSGALGWPSSDVLQLTANGGGNAQAFQNGSIYYTAASGAHSVSGPIREAYFALLGEGGALGWPTGDPKSATVSHGGGMSQTFQKGTIYWSTSYGAHALSGAMATAFAATGGLAILGWPQSDLLTLTANGGGTAQSFQGGSFYAATGGNPILVSGSIASYYWSLLGEGGALGWPTGAVACESATSICSQSFQHGTINTSTAGGTWLGSSPEINSVYSALGGPSGSLGKPTSVVLPVTANGGGLAQAFEGGSIYWSAATGGFAVTGPIRNAYWAALGEAGALGFPTSAGVAKTANGGGTTQSFQGGSIYSVTKSNVSRVVSGPIKTAYAASGAEGGSLGWPTSDLITITVSGGGTAQAFQGGSIYSSAKGSFAVTGGIRDYYWSLLGEGGVLGFPQASPVCVADGSCTQVFAGGTVYWSPTEGAHTVMPQIDAAYQALGGAAGSLGARVGGLQPSTANGGGMAQGFQKGSIYWSSPTGAFAVAGGVRDFYWSKLGEGGSLGWPTAAAVCGTVSQGCSQTFQHGTIVWTQANGGSLK